MGMYVAERKPSFTRHVLQKVDPTTRIRKMKAILELLRRIIHELEEAGEDYEEELTALEDLTDGE